MSPSTLQDAQAALLEAAGAVGSPFVQPVSPQGHPNMSQEDPWLWRTSAAAALATVPENTHTHTSRNLSREGDPAGTQGLLSCHLLTWLPRHCPTFLLRSVWPWGWWGTLSRPRPPLPHRLPKPRLQLPQWLAQQACDRPFRSQVWSHLTEGITETAELGGETRLAGAQDLPVTPPHCQAARH